MSASDKSESSPGDDPAGRHRARMQRTKAAVDARVAAATAQRAVQPVLTGNGKGNCSRL
jgi:cob(I)alamin adenosyltransferase